LLWIAALLVTASGAGGAGYWYATRKHRLVRAHEDHAPGIKVVHVLGGSFRIAYAGQDAGLAKTAFAAALKDGQSAEYWVGDDLRGRREGSG
jgi:hypothetical protein